MGKIKNIFIEIDQMLADGLDPKEIAKMLGVPLQWVTEQEMDMDWTDYPVDEAYGS